MISTLILAGAVVGFGVSRLPYFQNTDSASQSAASAVQSPETKTQPKEPVLTEEEIAGLTDDDPVMGSSDAPITMVEFSDFQCPYCYRFFTEVFPLIEENYIKTGKVKFVYRDFPLSKHPQAGLTAEAAQCAHDQGKFSEMHDLIFQNQMEWAGNPEAAKLMNTYAESISLNMTQFYDCMKTHKYAQETRKDLIDGATMGVTGTPTFFVNGKYLVGVLPYEEVFKPVFEAILAGKEWKLQFNVLGEATVVTP